MKEFKHKIISVLIAVALIVIIAAIAFGGSIYQSIKSGEEFGPRTFLAILYPEKYSYSTEQADLSSYFALYDQEDVTIVLQDGQVGFLETKAKYWDQQVYFSMDTIQELFTNRFYVNEADQTLLYTTSDSIYTVKIGIESTGVYTSQSIGELGTLETVPYRIANRDAAGNLYVAAEYVKRFANFSYAFYENPKRVLVNTKWLPYREAELVKNTNVRYQGGIKSPILRSMNEGERVVVLEIMENWTKIETTDGFIGYVENSTLTEAVEVTQLPETGAYDPAQDYATEAQAEDLLLGFHQIYYADDGSGFNDLYASTSGLDVVCPTWFYLNSASGTYDSYATSAYVANAHAKGLQVWALIEDMTYDVDEYSLFSTTSARRALIQRLVSDCTALGADGINIDFERIGKETGPHYVQFLRELSLEAHKQGLLLSVDNYVKNAGNLYYDLQEQGYVADYVVVMGYDEHWAGSEAGSVASIGFTEKAITSTMESGVPGNKILCGIPFYTRIWRIEGAETNSEAVGMDYAKEWVNNRGLTPVWDEESCQNYVTYQDGTALYQIWMEDTNSVTARMSVISQYDIGGVAAWKLGLENDEVWSIINAYQ